jgi:integrase
MAYIAADETKGKRPIGVPLNDRAVEVLRSQLGHNDEEGVFVYRGAPVTSHVFRTGGLEKRKRLGNPPSQTF